MLVKHLLLLLISRFQARFPAGGSRSHEDDFSISSGRSILHLRLEGFFSSCRFLRIQAMFSSVFLSSYLHEYQISLLSSVRSLRFAASRVRTISAALALNNLQHLLLPS